MLIHLYSANTAPLTLPKKDEERQQRPMPNGNGHVRIPTATDRQAADAQEFELDGLMSDDDDAEHKPLNGRPA